MMKNDDVITPSLKMPEGKYTPKEATISKEHQMKMILKARAKGVALDVLKKLVEYWDCKAASEEYLLIRTNRYKEIMETLENSQTIPSLLRDLEYRKKCADEDFY